MSASPLSSYSFGGLTTGLDALLDDLEHFLVGRFVTVGDLKFWMSANVRLIGLSLALSLAFIAAILAFFSVSFIDMFVPLFLDRSNTVLILRVYQSAVLYPCRRHHAGLKPMKRLGAMTTVIMRTSDDNHMVILALFQKVFPILGPANQPRFP